MPPLNKQQWEKHAEERKLRRIDALAENVRFYRLLRRKTLRQLADESGCSPHTIYRVEHRIGELKFSTQQRIAEALGVDVFDLQQDLPGSPAEVPQSPKPKKVQPRPRIHKKKKGR